MKINALSPDDYASQVQAPHREAFDRLRSTLHEHLPAGFSEQLSYGMIGYVVPHSLYPSGYHVSPELPLPFISLGAQKNFIGLYHMGLYADPDMLDWWQREYASRVPSKLDMGKSCVRLKKMEHIPYDLIAELCQRMTPQQWIARYESQINPRK